MAGSGCVAAKGRTQRVVLELHQVVVFGSARLAPGRRDEDAGVELDEVLEAGEEQVSETLCHAPLLVVWRWPSDITAGRLLQRASEGGAQLLAVEPECARLVVGRRTWAAGLRSISASYSQ